MKNKKGHICLNNKKNTKYVINMKFFWKIFYAKPFAQNRPKIGGI